MPDDVQDVPFSFSGSDEPIPFPDNTAQATAPAQQVVTTALARQQHQGPAQLAIGASAALAMATREQAIIRARFELAKQYPRSLQGQVRTSILDACKRPGFAAAAIYSKPIGGGKKAEGFSVRFAEACLQSMGHMTVDDYVVEEDDRRIRIAVVVSDNQTGSSVTKTVTVQKTTEVTSIRDGQEHISTRTNSEGRKTHLVVANEDQLENKKASAISKATRNGILRLVPADLLDEAKAQCKQTATSQDSVDPKRVLRNLVDSFHEQGVPPTEIEKWLGRPLDGSRVGPHELGELRMALGALRDGEARWSELLETHRQSPAPKHEETTAPVATRNSGGATIPTEPTVAKAESPVQAAATPPEKKRPESIPEKPTADKVEDDLIAEFRKWARSDAASLKGLQEWAKRAGSSGLADGGKRFGLVYKEVRKMLQDGDATNEPRQPGEDG